MHTPGVCGAILAVPHAEAVLPMGASGSESETTGRLGRWIDALNADTEMILVAGCASDEALAREVWARAAYLVQLPEGASLAQALRAVLQETLNRGRDAALVTTLQTPPVSAETVRRMVAAYRAAGDEVWALVPQIDCREQSANRNCYPMLLGRQMIELFLRQQSWNAPEEILLAHREHVYALKASGIAPACSGTTS